jgi:hypothetical protein
MVTKNQKLLTVGGQLGLGAGVAGIATAFMNGGVATGLSGAAQVASAADGGSGGVPSGNTAPIPNTAINTDMSSLAPGAEPPLVSSPVTSAPLGPPVDNSAISDLNMFTPPSPASTPAVAPQGAEVGTKVVSGAGRLGAGLGDFNLTTANDNTQAFRNDAYNFVNGGGTPVSQQATPDGSFFDSIFAKNPDGTYKDSSKYMMMEGGKIVAGGIQGMSTTSNANAQLQENRRVGDIQRANAAQVGQSRYGLMRP